MFLRSVSLNYFRNYSSQEAVFEGSLNIFTGKNAQGKTNLLEAIFFLSTGRSFRTSRVSEMIQSGSSYLRVAGEVERAGSLVKLKIYYSEKAKVAHQNARKVRRFHELVGILKAVVFAPDDIEIIKGPPARRRRYLDMQIAQINKEYMRRLQRYNEVVKHRNAVLRSGDRREMGVWDEELVRYGVPVLQERKETVKRLNLLARLARRKLSDGKEELQARSQDKSGKREADREDRCGAAQGRYGPFDKRT